MTLEESPEASHRIMIREDGWAHGKDAKDAFYAHTSDDPRAKDAGPHVFLWTAAARSGAKGKLVIRWHGMVAGTARVGASVDLNGDKRAE